MNHPAVPAGTACPTSPTMKRICSIYKSPRKNEMYLYVDKREALSRVPEGLLSAFGAPQHTFDLVLSPERQLAREDIGKVLENIEKQGYHLQMPPAQDEYIEHLPEELLRMNDPL
ncbi:Protein YcgL [compost metagenome]